MSWQPSAGDAYTNIGTVGTVSLSDRDVRITRVIIPGTYVGSVALYDVAAIAGTTAGNNIITFGLPATSIPQSIELDIQCKKGLVYASTGTPNLTIVWN